MFGNVSDSATEAARRRPTCYTQVKKQEKGAARLHARKRSNSAKSKSDVRWMIMHELSTRPNDLAVSMHLFWWMGCLGELLGRVERVAWESWVET